MRRRRRSRFAGPERLRRLFDWRSPEERRVALVKHDPQFAAWQLAHIEAQRNKKLEAFQRLREELS
jgi:hypothetical protein